MHTSRMLVATLLLLSAVVAAPAAATGDDDTNKTRQTVDRVSGDDRISTAVQLSQRAFPVADVAVLATAAQYPDALAGGVLAAKLGGPLLLTQTDDLPAAVVGELDRLGVTSVVLLGGTGAISNGVADDLAARGIAVDRVSGADRWETAVRIAERVTDGQTPDRVVLVTGSNFPDAVSASAFAASQGWPILLTPSGSVLDSLTDYLADAQPAGILPVGGPAAISEAVLDQLRSDYSVRARLEGPSRWATSYQVTAAHHDRNPNVGEVWLATGENFPDALAAGPAAAAVGALLQLTPSSTTDVDGSLDVRGFVERFRACDGSGQLADGVLVGGTAALSGAVAEQLDALLACEPFPEPPGTDCHPSYPDFCVPPPPPDLNCSDFSQQGFTVRHDVPNPDPHNLDGNQDGVACEG